MTNARKNRGTGNGGSAYRNSPLWDAIEKNGISEGKSVKGGVNRNPPKSERPSPPAGQQCADGE